MAGHLQRQRATATRTVYVERGERTKYIASPMDRRSIRRDDAPDGPAVAATPAPTKTCNPQAHPPCGPVLSPPPPSTKDGGGGGGLVVVGEKLAGAGAGAGGREDEAHQDNSKPNGHSSSLLPFASFKPLLLSSLSLTHTHSHTPSLSSHPTPTPRASSLPSRRTPRA